MLLPLPLPLLLLLPLLPLLVVHFCRCHFWICICFVLRDLAIQIGLQFVVGSPYTSEQHARSRLKKVYSKT